MRWGRQMRADSEASVGEFMLGMPGVGLVKRVYWTCGWHEASQAERVDWVGLGFKTTWDRDRRASVVERRSRIGGMEGWPWV